MSYTKQRFFTNNRATSDTTTASSQAAGTLQQAKRTQDGASTGTSLCIPVGSFTGANNILYIIQCDGAGTVDSTATIRWKTSESIGWEATGVSATTTPMTLNNGVQILYSAGTLVLNDTDRFWAYAEYGPGKLFVNDRNLFWKSAALTELVTDGDGEDVAGWTAVDCTLASVTGGSSENCIQLTVTGGSTQYFHQTITTVAGEKYRLKIYVKSGTSGNEAFRVSAASTAIIDNTTSGTWTQYTATFVATGATTIIEIFKMTATAGTMLFDEIECRLIPSFELNLGSALQVTAIALTDHNLSSDAIVTVAFNSSPSWGAPPATETLLNGANSDPAVAYIDRTYQCIKWFIDDAWNEDGYISIGKLYCGTYTELAEDGAVVSWGSAYALQATKIRNMSDSGKRTGHVYGEVPAFDTHYKFLNATDLATYKGVYEATRDLTYGDLTSIFIHYWTTTNTDYFHLMHCLSDEFRIVWASFDLHEVILSWIGEVMTRII